MYQKTGYIIFRYHFRLNMARYILEDMFYDPPIEIVYKNKDELIDALLERIGELHLRVVK